MGTSITLSDDLKKRATSLLSGTQTLSQFVYAATEEKINRMEKRDEESRRKTLTRNVDALMPVLRIGMRRVFAEMKEAGEL